MALSPFAFLLWQLRLEGPPFLYFHRVTSVFNSWELPRQNAGGQGLERCAHVEVVAERSKKVPFFCRLEIEILLRVLGLRPFLIGRSAIRNRVVSIRFPFWNGGSSAARL